MHIHRNETVDDFGACPLFDYIIMHSQLFFMFKNYFRFSNPIQRNLFDFFLSFCCWHQFFRLLNFAINYWNFKFLRVKIFPKVYFNFGYIFMSCTLVWWENSFFWNQITDLSVFKQCPYGKHKIYFWDDLIQFIETRTKEGKVDWGPNILKVKKFICVSIMLREKGHRETMENVKVA